MKFTNTAPKWDAAGIVPTEDLQKEGFKAGYKPPAPFFNYLFNQYTKAVNEIQQNLSNVDNTADAKKPVSEAQKAAIDAMLISGAGAGSIVSIADSAAAPFNALTVYGASEQQTYTGKNLLKITAATQTLNGITFTVNGDGSVTINGTAAGLFALPVGKVELKANTEYFIGGCPAGGTGNTYRLDGRELEENGGEAIPDIIDYGQGVKFTPTTDRAINICIRIASGATVSNIKFYPLVQLASITDTSYEPYTGGVAAPNPDYPQVINSVGDSGSVKVTSCGKNLVENTGTTQTKDGITFTVNDDKTVTVNGTATADVSLFVFTNLQNVLKVGEKYILNGAPSGCSTDTYYMEVNNIWYGDIGNGAEFTFKQGITGCYIVVRSGATVSNKVFKPMIRLATVKDGSYEQHKKTTATVPLSLPLYGIPVTSGGNYTDENGQQWICDEIDTARGVYVQRCYTHVVTEINNIGATSNNRASVILPYAGTANYLASNALSSHFEYKPSVYSDSGDEVGFVVSNETMFFRFGSGSEISTMEKAQAWLTEQNSKGNPLKCTYPLATPIETPLTPEQLTALYSLYSYEGATNVFTNDIGELSVEYFKNTENGKAAGAFKESLNLSVIDLLNGTLPVGDSNNLGGKSADLYALLADLANYLSLSGGIVGTGSTTIPFGIKGQGGSSYTIYFNDDESMLGFLGMNGANKPSYMPADRSTAYDLFHTGNKPSGSYVGNGSAESRTISSGGLGSACIIVCPYLGKNALVLPYGAILFGTGGTIEYVHGFGFADGNLTIATDNAVLNGSGVTYYYQTL